MTFDSLEGLVQGTDDLVSTFRNNDLIYDPYIFPDQYTHWIEEQRAVRETCAIVDQSYHMHVVRVHGSDATQFLEELGVNSFEKVRRDEPPQAINYLMCNPDGYVIGDVIIFHLDENTFWSVGAGWSNNWLLYNGEITDLDVTTEMVYDPFEGRDPPDFRFQIQGPEALSVMETVTDDPLPEIPFFQMDTLSIGGEPVFALSHGMAAMPGLEIFGHYERHGTVFDAILEAGEEHGIRKMGSKAYKTGKIGSGWIVMPVPAIYRHEELRGYREWLDADGTEGALSIGGSFVGEDITAYYMTPMARGQGHLIDFDHDFVGKEALERMVNHQRRERVTLVWNDEDVTDVYRSLFDDRPTAKFVDLPDTATTWSKTHYDAILKDGEEVGVSKYPGYLSYEREMLSLATIDLEYSDPGTEVTFVWGDESAKTGVERHQPQRIRATVAPAPYVRGGRQEM